MDNMTEIYDGPRLRPLRTGSERPKRRKAWIIVILAIFVAGSFFAWSRRPEKNPDATVAGVETKADEAILEKPDENVAIHTVSEGDIPAEVFAEYGKLDANETASLLAAAEDVYDFSKIKIGQKIEFVLDEKEKAKKIKYYPDSENMVIAEADGETFKVKKGDIPYEVKQESLVVKIDEFLYKNALDAGLSEASILEAADVFSFDIDFSTDIREGDEMKVIYEKRTMKGQPAPDGNIIAAKFTNVGQEYFAYYFEADGEGSHYDSEGKELMRQFLRAPLSYRKITSGYTGARYHPITKTVSAHYQIDYAAPIGTPVVSTARGTVTSARYEGGWGNIVRIKHDNGYSTHYGHLSAYAKGMKAGASVSQGQVVGYVGSTGWSTGPHLDYGMRLNGNPVNPLSIKLPKGTPLEGENMEKFQELKKRYDELLK